MSSIDIRSSAPLVDTVIFAYASDEDDSREFSCKIVRSESREIRIKDGNVGYANIRESDIENLISALEYIKNHWIYYDK